MGTSAGTLAAGWREVLVIFVLRTLPFLVSCVCCARKCACCSLSFACCPCSVAIPQLPLYVALAYLAVLSLSARLSLLISRPCNPNNIASYYCPLCATH